MTPPLYGLVLAGGQSRRMGTDKGRLVYNSNGLCALEQRIHVHQMLSLVCEKVFISCRDDQAHSLPSEIPYITDHPKDLGPSGGILSAHSLFPEAAWLVLACDLPLIDIKFVQQLKENRDPRLDATATTRPDTQQLEPLIAIWEPSALCELRSRVNAGNKSPKKCLEQLRVQKFYPHDVDQLTNVNIPEELKRVIQRDTST